ncbi:RNA exonuclease 4 [Bactrocera tryoni]|uniref:RNA exonuclease 4 n=1 Tax=Bactrocera tryoni TaxID=59916 RepID=UPI001A99D216|nr:RNA exonuclease 4 [Bactrocera tryoni]
MSQQYPNPQQKSNEPVCADNNKKNGVARQKLDQQNLKTKLFEVKGSGDGGSVKQKHELDHSKCQLLKSKSPLQATTGAFNQLKHKESITCMDQLQQQMQSILSCTEINEKQHNCQHRNNAGSQRCSRRNSLNQEQKCDHHEAHDQHPNSENNRPLSKSARLRQKRKAAQRNKYVAIDCEMVGVGHNGQDDMLARVSIVNKQGEVLLDKFVKPWIKVTDYRTSVSGIRPKDIENGEDFHLVQDEVVELLQGKILVGHAIRNDLAVLHIKHPYKNIRDTARYKPLCRLVSNGRTPSLKLLSQAILGMEIQIGEHNSVEDARAAMKIYNCLSGDWEKYVQKQQHNHHK